MGKNRPGTQLEFSFCCPHSSVYPSTYRGGMRGQQHFRRGRNFEKSGRISVRIFGEIRLPICTARCLNAVEHPSETASKRQILKLVKVAKMTRLSRELLFTPDEIAIVHVMNRAVRRCFLMGYDQFTGRNYDYRKDWIEHRIEHLAKYFSIDVSRLSA
jgi:hypothetical protein